MTDQLQKWIKACNLRPANKAAAEVLSQMGQQHDPQQLAVLELLEAKAESEGRTPPDNVTEDLYDLKQGLTADWVHKITERLTEEGTDVEYLAKINAETLLDWITEALPLDQFSPRSLQGVVRD